MALNWAIDSVRKGGTISVIGAYGPIFSSVKFGDAMNKGLDAADEPKDDDGLHPGEAAAGRIE